MAYNKKNSDGDFSDLDFSEKSIITSEEVDKLNDEYYKELFNAVPFFVFNDSTEDLTESRNHSNQKNILANYFKLPLFLNIFQQPIKNIISDTEPNDKPIIPNKIKSIKSDKTKNNKFLIVNEIKKFSSDPLRIIIVALISIFFYIYFANEFMCHILGLFYPLYYLYILMHYRNANCSEKIRSMIKYFIIYGHIDFLSSLTKIVGVYLYHLKIFVILCVLYMTGYQREWLNVCYDSVIFYDRIFLNMILTFINKIYNEYIRLKTDIVNESKKNNSRKKID